MNKKDDLATRSCKPCEGGVPPLKEEEILLLIKKIPDWHFNSIGDVNRISRTFEFKNYFRTIAFVNAIAWIAHQENHHPDLEVSYNRCIVHYSTHAVNGLTENDFICAAKVNALVNEK